MLSRGCGNRKEVEIVGVFENLFSKIEPAPRGGRLE
jgi:hypothetical protein